MAASGRRAIITRNSEGNSGESDVARGSRAVVSPGGWPRCARSRYALRGSGLITKVGKQVPRLARIQVWLALAAGGLAALVGLFFIAQAFAVRELCYGVRAFKNPCEALTPASFFRLLFILVVVLALYAIAAFAAWGQHRAQDPTTRTTALMAMVTCTLLLSGVTLAAISAAGRYLVPSLILLLAAVAVGVVSRIQEARSTSAG